MVSVYTGTRPATSPSSYGSAAITVRFFLLDRFHGVAAVQDRNASGGRSSSLTALLARQELDLGILGRMWRMAIAATLALVVDVRPADSCSCAYEPAEIWPVQGATDVPLNARITVRSISTQNLTVTLRDETGATVPLVFTERLASD